MKHQHILPSKESLLEVFPSNQHLKTYKAVLECYEAIPCNPCEHHCPFDAIIIGENINTPPRLVVDKCTGCGICVRVCPGLAIMLAKVSETQASFVIPYEFNPKPKVDETWYGVNRSGEILGDVLIKRVMDTKANDHTSLVTVQTAPSLLHEFITIKRKSHEE
jgi:Fe-S-cluster-containing hydrogenase component 2